MEGGIWVCCFFFSLFVMLGEEGGSDEQRVSQGGGVSTHSYLVLGGAHQSRMVYND